MRTLLLILALFVALPLSAAVTYDNSANTQCGNQAPLTACSGTPTVQTLTFTTGSGGNRAMAVFVSVACQTGQPATTVSAVDYGGDSLSQLLHTSNGVANYTDLWKLPAGTQPQSGSHTLTATLTGDLNADCSGGYAWTFSLGVITAAGVDQTTTFTSSNSANGTSASATVTISSSGANDLGVASSCGGETFTSTAETQRWNTTTGGNSCGISIGTTAAGGTTTFTETLMGSDHWDIAAAAFKAAASCTPSKVAFTDQPGNATVGAALGTVIVNVQDAGSNNCAGDTSTITISNKAATCSGMTLGGTMTGANPFTIANLTENAAGACTLHVTDGALTAGDSSAFTISAAPAGSKSSLFLGVGR